MSESTTLESASLYTIAWIAAIQEELTATFMMLDDEHNAPSDFKKHASDENIYTWGRIGKHNIVIANLPDGEIGTTAAANTANGLRMSLPHIRIGLMVGIGAGIPKCDDEKMTVEREILLGDVVVSEPNESNGGVIQYDFKKVRSKDGEQKSELKGFLNASPRVLRNAVAKLKAKHAYKPSKIVQFLQIFKENDLTREAFTYPETGKDWLREALQRKASNDITGPGLRKLPKIHYGTIASGNTVVKDAKVRDEILRTLEKENVRPVCFEMEAGGLMNIFPCLVIRGISDYADEHKHDDWKGYAAATAAAFAKEFLGYLDDQDVGHASTIGTILSSVQNVLESLHDVHSATADIKNIVVDEQRSKILDWLCPEDYLGILRTHIRTHLSGTGKWFLQSPPFKVWMSKDGRSKALYCPGAPGVGKTIQAAIVANALRKRKVACLVVFCDYTKRKEQTSKHFLSSLVRQIASACPSIPIPIQKFYNSYKSRRDGPTNEELLSLLNDILSKISRIHIVIDALDECQSSCCTELITELRSLARDWDMRLLATSRALPDVRDLFSGAMELQIVVPEQDIEAVIRNLTAKLRSRVNITPQFEEQIVTKISNAAGGLFLLVRLHVQSLQAQTNARDMANVLSKLRSGLTDAYNATMERIVSQEVGLRQLAQSALKWIVHAKRPLMVPELLHALATREDDTSFQEDGVVKIELLLSACAGLLEVDNEYVDALLDNGPVVRLVHSTAQDYFEQEGKRHFPKASVDLARTCIVYFTLDDFATDIIHPLGTVPGDFNIEALMMLKQRHARYPFLDYACHNAGRHAADARSGDKSGENTSALVKVAARLFSKQKALDSTHNDFLGGYKPLYRSIEYHLWVLKGIFSYSAFWTNKDARGFTAWHWLASWDLLGLYETLQCYIRYTDNADTRGRTPLSFATVFGHTDMVLGLIRSGLIDFRPIQDGDKDMTPLRIARKLGYRDICQALVDTGAYLDEEEAVRAWIERGDDASDSDD